MFVGSRSQRLMSPVACASGLKRAANPPSQAERRVPQLHRRRYVATAKTAIGGSNLYVLAPCRQPVHMML